MRGDRRQFARSAVTACIVAMLGFAMVPAARATLGGTDTSVKVDRAQMHSSLRTTVEPRFTMHELETPSRTRVREYVAPSGVVFGVAWQGPAQPDLRQILGPYFQQYVDALSQRRTRRAPVTVALPGLVVRSGGHMRAFTGKAWLPPALPSGVTPSDVR